jgi:ThiF family
MDGLVFSASFLRRALLKVRERRLSGFLTVHTHPLADHRVGFSEYDDLQDPVLMRNLHDLEPSGTFGSLVLSRNSIAGRLWPRGSTKPASLDRLMIVGEQLEIFSLSGNPLQRAQPAELFDRAFALTGTGALSTMNIGVVGAGGTGSLMIELLARAGAGQITVFDFDIAQESNLNRVVHLRRSDVSGRRLKVERLREAIAESGLPTNVVMVPGGDIREARTAAELRSCDLLIGCVDRDWPRLVLCEVAYQYLIPLIDIGAEIGVADMHIQSVDSRVSFVGPGRPCLCCSGVISADRIRVEGYSTDEQNRVLNMGYTQDIRIKAPAVMDLNMRSASTAMLLLRHLLQPYLLTPLPHAIKEAVTNFAMCSMKYNSKFECTLCGTDAAVQLADSAVLTTRSDLHP